MSRKLIVKNKKARFEYEILETVEAGMVLQGTEIKSLREGRVNLKESFARIHNGEVWLEGCHISPYSHGNVHNHDPLRPRKLLLHKRQIDQLTGKVEQKGLTLIPLAIFLSNGKAKLDLAVGRGKKLHDKRETARRKTVQREIEAELKRR